MSSSINICCMNLIHPENASELPPATATSPTESTPSLKERCKFFLFILCLLLLVTVFFTLLRLLHNFFHRNDPWEPQKFPTFEVESLSLISPYNTSEKHWNITLRVGNPNTQLGANYLSYNVSHVYLSLHGQLIARGDLPAFNLLKKKEALVNGTLNAILSQPEDKILNNLGNLWLNIVVSVGEAERILGVLCLSFQNVSSSATQGIQMQSRQCSTGINPSDDE